MTLFQLSMLEDVAMHELEIVMCYLAMSIMLALPIFIWPIVRLHRAAKFAKAFAARPGSAAAVDLLRAQRLFWRSYVICQVVVVGFFLFVLCLAHFAKHAAP